LNREDREGAAKAQSHRTIAVNAEAQSRRAIAIIAVQSHRSIAVQSHRTIPAIEFQSHRSHRGSTQGPQSEETTTTVGASPRCCDGAMALICDGCDALAVFASNCDGCDAFASLAVQPAMARCSGSTR
jgi:hypothetical protein